MSAKLSTSAGISSGPDASLFVRPHTAMPTSCKDGVRSRSGIIGSWESWSVKFGSWGFIQLTNSLRCSAQRESMPCWSLMTVLPSFNFTGCITFCTGPWTALQMIGKGFYSKWVKSSFEHFITTQTRVGSTNGWIISQHTEILKFYFSTISGNLRNLWRHLTASITLDVPLT